MTRFVAISDTHGLHADVAIPDGDVLLHAGDFTNRGTLKEIEAFDKFLEPLPHTYKIIIAGNHDLAFENEPEQARSRITSATYLQDELITINGVSLYGSPWQPWFHNWAFNLKRGQPLAEKWSAIPDYVDVLITHGPPKGIGDRTWMGSQVGCDDLAERVKLIAPRIHLFGHIHEAYGKWHIGKTLFINASINASLFRGTVQRLNPPIIFDL